MAHESQESEAIIARQKKDIEHLTNRILQMDNWRSRQEQAWGFVRQLVDEAINLSVRTRAFLVANDKKTATFKAELVKMEQVFRDRKRNFEDVLNGYPVAESAVEHESVGNNASEERKSGSPEQELKSDSGEAPAGMDSSRSGKKRKNN